MVKFIREGPKAGEGDNLIEVVEQELERLDLPEFYNPNSDLTRVEQNRIFNVGRLSNHRYEEFLKLEQIVFGVCKDITEDRTIGKKFWKKGKYILELNINGKDEVITYSRSAIYRKVIKGALQTAVYSTLVPNFEAKKKGFTTIQIIDLRNLIVLNPENIFPEVYSDCLRAITDAGKKNGFNFIGNQTEIAEQPKLDQKHSFYKTCIKYLNKLRD